MAESGKEKRLWLSPLVPDKDFEVQFRDDHIRINIGPDYVADRAQSTEFWTVLRSLSQRHGTRRVLIEGYPPKVQQSTVEVIEAGREAGTIPNLWIAFCLKDFVPSELGELFEATATAHGTRAKFFTDQKQALNWLRQNAPA